MLLCPLTDTANLPHTLPPHITTAPDLPCGHPFLPVHGRLRVWSNNINGMSSDNGFAALHQLSLALKLQDVGAIALQETNLDFTKQAIRDAVESIISKHFGAVWSLQSAASAPRRLGNQAAFY
jgi:hypothetical protein